MDVAILTLALGITFAIALGLSRLLLELMLNAMVGGELSPVGAVRRWVRRH
jgi:hypothetical protein